MKRSEFWAMVSFGVSAFWLWTGLRFGFNWYRVVGACAGAVALGMHFALAMVDRGDE